MKLQTWSCNIGLSIGGSSSSSGPMRGTTTSAQTSGFSHQRNIISHQCCNLTIFYGRMWNKIGSWSPSNCHETEVPYPQQNYGPLFLHLSGDLCGDGHWQWGVAWAGGQISHLTACSRVWTVPRDTLKPLTFRSKIFLSHRAQMWGKWRGATPRRSPSWCGSRERVGRSGVPPLHSSFCLMRGLPKLCTLWLRRPKEGGAAVLNFVSGVGSSGLYSSFLISYCCWLADGHRLSPGMRSGLFWLGKLGIFSHWLLVLLPCKTGPGSPFGWEPVCGSLGKARAAPCCAAAP